LEICDPAAIQCGDSTCSPTRSTPARIPCGPVKGRVRFGTWPFMCCFLDLYLSSEGESLFRPPPPFGVTELDPAGVLPERTYGKDELLGYLEHCRKELDAVMMGMIEAWVASPCPFPYRDMSNGELLLYNMRHVQHHAA
jgi:hypothetical protein